MAVGRISGPLLKDNLLRNGVNLAFETNLLYLDVVNSRVGINTSTPTNDLSVNGTTRTTNLYASTQANLGLLQFSGSTISSNNSTITLTPTGTNAVVYQGLISVGNLNITGNTVSNTVLNDNINITANGTGQVVIGTALANNNVLINGNLHATGSITADGNITLGDANTDSITFDAEINSDVLPNANTTYNLGSSSLKWATLYTTNISAATVTTTDFTSSGNLSVSGTSTLSGNTSVGASSSNTLNIVASVNSNIVPSTTNTYSLGSSSYYWNNGYITTINTAGMQITSNSITATGTNSNLQLSANGTGSVTIPTSNFSVTNNVAITGTLTVSGTSTLGVVGITGTITQTGDFNQTGNFSTSGNVTVSGNITGSGSLTIPNITISGNTITTNTGNLDLYLLANGTGSVFAESIKVTNNNIQASGSYNNILLTPQSTGSVVINNTQSLVVPVGTAAQRPGTPTNGMVRYNSDVNRYEGYANGYWTNLGGVQSVDGKTRITPESTPGAGNNVIYFYANNNLTATIDSSKLYTIDFQTSALDITSNTISALTSNTDINFTTSGTGGVVIGNLKFTGNSITNTASNAVTVFNETGTGYVKVSGTYGVVLPWGSTAQRPGLAYEETGMTRFNTDLGYVEIYNGTIWTSVAGTSSGVTSATAQDIGVQTALTLG
jgi:hypothetical protein